jgi:hypothetical protein
MIRAGYAAAFALMADASRNQRIPTVTVGGNDFYHLFTFLSFLLGLVLL